MPHLETIDISPSTPPLWRRMWEAVRSSWSGPLTSSSPDVARYFTDGSPSRAGVAVSGDSALTYPAFWAAVSLISADLASLPLILYRRESNGGKTRFTDHQLYRILHDEPNPEMSSLVFRETLQAHALVWGNGYSEIERDALGRVRALWPLTPNRVQPFRDQRDPLGPLRYRVLNEDNTETILQAQDVLHVPGLGFDGYLGYSVIAKARESLGLGIAMQQFGASFFGNGSTFGGVFVSPRALGDKEKKDLTTELKAFHQGLDRAHRFVVLEGGMDYKRLGVPPDDAQFLESRSFHIADIARWFKVPPHKLGDLSRATFSNIEHQAIDYVTTCLRPWAKRWEQEINRKLIAPSERRIQFVEHLFEDLLKGDIQSRYAAYAVGRQWGWLSADDVREKENMNPLPSGAGSMYLVPQNMWPADKVDEMIAAQANKDTSSAPAAPADDAPMRKAVALLEERLARADASIASAEETLRAREATLATLTEERDTTAQDLAEARAAVEAERANVARITELKAGVESELVEAKAAAEAEARTRARAEQDTATAQAETITERAAREAAEACAIRHAEEAETARGVAQAARDEAMRSADAERIASERERDAMTAQQAAHAAREAEEAARVTAEAEREAARAEAVEANLSYVKVARDLEAAQQLITESEARIAVLTETEATLRTQLEHGLEDIRRLETELAAEQAVKDAEVRHARERLDAAQTAVEQAEQRATDAQEAQARITVALRDLEAAERERLGAVLSAHRALIVDVMRRMVERETDRARRAQTTPEKLRHWIETFYPGHEELCVSALLPAIRVHTSWMGRYEDAEGLTRMLVRQHIEESKRQISAVADGDSDELAGSLYQLFERWDRERVPAIADMLLQKEIDRAASSHT